MHTRHWPWGSGYRVAASLLPIFLIAFSTSLAPHRFVAAQEIGAACPGGECVPVANSCSGDVGNGCDCSDCGYDEADSGLIACGRATGGCGLAKCGCALGLGCKSGDCGDGTHCGLPAPSYPVPFATPRPTAPTYFTYPPMMPHNSLPHYRSTYSFRHGPGLSRTEVHWRSKKLLNVADYLHHLIEIPR